LKKKRNVFSVLSKSFLTIVRIKYKYSSTLNLYLEKSGCWNRKWTLTNVRWKKWNIDIEVVWHSKYEHSKCLSWFGLFIRSQLLISSNTDKTSSQWLITNKSNYERWHQCPFVVFHVLNQNIFHDTQNLFSKSMFWQL
jgi:hypothetical protein